ncbi:cystathionine gamma-lyase-like isoform X2 [Planococcus citri]
MSTEGFLPEDTKFSTRAIHAGHSPEKWSSMAVITPISLSTTFKQFGPGEPKQFEYSRSDNPTRNVLESCLASLDGGRFALAFSSGLGALNAVVQLLNAGDHVICMDDVYGGTNRYFSKIATKFCITVTFVDLSDVKNLDKEIKPNTKLIWIENPTNPMMKVVDVRSITRFAKFKSRDVMVVVDNTFLTPYFQKPLALGADISVYSLTKYMNGHSDVVMGAAVTNSEVIYSELKFIQNASGVVPSPFDCYLVDRSLKTLCIRMKQHMENGLRVARFLESHPMVLKVLHPGLESHPGYNIAKQQWSGCSGMLSFYIKGDIEDTKLFIKKLKYFICAESLGGFESLVEVPSLMTHTSVSAEERERLGITDNLVRTSVGLESADDLVEDLNQALLAVQATKKK